MVAAFVERLTPEVPEKVAYVTHVASGTQAILNREGQVIHRHDGGADGPGRLDALLNDKTAMTRVMEGLTNGQDVRPKKHTISWIPMMQYTGTRFVGLGWTVAGQGTGKGERGIGLEYLGPELYRVAFRGDGYAGAFRRYQDGDATYLNPATPVYAVRGYSPNFPWGPWSRAG